MCGPNKRGLNYRHPRGLFCQPCNIKAKAFPFKSIIKNLSQKKKKKKALLKIVPTFFFPFSRKH